MWGIEEAEQVGYNSGPLRGVIGNNSRLNARWQRAWCFPGSEVRDLGVAGPSYCQQLAFPLLGSTFMLNVAQNLSVNPLLQYGLLYIIGKLLMSSF